MTKQHRIHLRGEQRKQIDADLMAQLVVMLGSELAEDARQAAEAARGATKPDRTSPDPADGPGEAANRRPAADGR